MNVSDIIRQLKTSEEQTNLEVKKAGKSTYYLPSSIFKDTMVDKTSISKSSIFDDIPNNLRLQINEQGKRSSNPAVVKQIIIDLCRWRELSSAEISLILGRNEKYIKSNYIQPLIDDKRISYTIPEMITHPSQKYKTIK